MNLKLNLYRFLMMWRRRSKIVKELMNLRLCWRIEKWQISGFRKNEPFAETKKLN